MKLYFFIFLFSIQLLSFGQVTLSPQIKTRNLNHLDILRIEITDENTTVDMRYTCMTNNENWICAKKEFYIKGVEQTERIFLLTTINIPICEEKYYFKNQKGATRDFRLIFPKLEAGIELVDIIEMDVQNDFSFYGVTINNPPNQTTKIEKTTQTTPKIISQKTTNTTTNKTSTTKKTDTNGKTVAQKKPTTKPITTTKKVTNTEIPEKPKLLFGTQKVGLKDSVNVQILFDKASDVIKTESTPELEKLLNFMNQNPTVVIEIIGHTEADEPNYTPKQRASNLQLSAERIKSVKDFLQTKGISPLRIQTKAYGGSKPISQDPTVNRRVVMKIIKF